MAIETQLEHIARSSWWRWLGWGGAQAKLIAMFAAPMMISAALFRAAANEPGTQ